MLRRRSYLQEGLFDIKVDVDWLYKKSGLDKIDRFLSGRKKSPEEIIDILTQLDKKKTFLKTTSAKLRSHAAQQAHQINPVSITIGKGREGSYYIPASHSKKGGSRIEVSINYAFSFAKSALYSQDPMSYMSSRLGDQMQRFTQEFDSSAIKGTIAHELNHWLSDTLYNGNVTTLITRKKASFAKEGLGLSSFMDQTPQELDSQIHAIQQIRDSVGDEAYAAFSWEDLFKAKSSLLSNFHFNDPRRGRSVLGEKEFRRVMKYFAKRLHREGLLTKPMRKLLTRNDFISINNRI
jgi:hypothetical protein